ncbi:MAG: hypothetical protein P1V97_19395 [Planctomycetota bacterium]|nr:hypothetical protein [Planctomycetota bacterium]
MRQASKTPQPIEHADSSADRFLGLIGFVAYLSIALMVFDPAIKIATPFINISSLRMIFDH